MSSKFRLLSIAVLALAIGGFTSSISAQEATTPQKEGVDKHEKYERHGRMKGEGFHGMHRGGMGMLRGLHGLNLTEAQKQQIHTILESNKPDQATMDQLKAFREARRSGTELTAEQKEQFRSIRQAQKDKMKVVHQQILNILTAEQRQQLEQRKQEMQERRELRKQNKPAATKPIEG